MLNGIFYASNTENSSEDACKFNFQWKILFLSLKAIYDILYFFSGNHSRNLIATWSRSGPLTMLIPRKLLKLHEIFSSLNVSTMLKDRSYYRHYLFKRHGMWLDKKKKKKNKWSRYFNWIKEYRNY